MTSPPPWDLDADFCFQLRELRELYIQERAAHNLTKANLVWWKNTAWSVLIYAVICTAGFIALAAAH